MKMRMAYFDCFSGISGDMIIGALIDLGLDINFLKNELKKLNLKNYSVEAKRVSKQGITATKFNAIADKEQANKELNLKGVSAIIDKSKLNENLKSTIKKIFLKIAKAESKIHNKPIDEIHFHELGAVDTILDVAGAVIGIDRLGFEKIYCSKINVGAGFVDFSHGKFPVPAPAAAELLKGSTIYHNGVEGELATPTGAAIITGLASKFGDMPAMNVEKIGYGAGTRNLGQPNVLRIFSGELIDNQNKEELISVIETNIDNMNPEGYPYVIDMLLENGALDAYLTNVIMKKGRPAIKLTVLANDEDAGKLCKIIFDETTTLGLRILQAERKILSREIKTIKTKYGNVKVKISKLGKKIQNISPEYEDCAKIAKGKKISLKKVYEETKSIRL